MEPLDFLRAVLPSAGRGVYCAMSGKKEHVFAPDVADLEPQFTRWNERGLDVYFALATFEGTRRLAANARYMRSLFVDMDGYETPQAAWKALCAFLKATGLWELGRPLAVVSGGGLHAYWPFTRDVEIAEWEPIAKNFKRLCKQEDLKIDMTVTADAARILRVPGTRNFKYDPPRDVQIVRNDSPGFDPGVLGDAIAGKLTTFEPVRTAQVLQLPGARPATEAANIRLFANSATHFKKLVDGAVSGGGCKQLGYYLENAADDNMEALWRGMLSLAQKCDDGPEKWGKRLSQLHPYDDERLQRKWIEIKGPYPCKALDEINPGVCPGCKHWGKITNPLALGRITLTTTESVEVAVPRESGPNEPERGADVINEGCASPSTGLTYTRPEPPYYFSYGARGGIFHRENPKDEEKPPRMVLPYDLFIVSVLHDAGQHYVRLYAAHPMGARDDIILPAKALNSKDETNKALLEQNIVAAGAENSKLLHQYLQHSASMISNERKATRMPEQFGWTPENHFVYAGRIYRKDRLPVSTPMSRGLVNIENATRPKGTLAGWKNVVQQVFVRNQMYEHLAVMLAGAGAPLMRYSGSNMNGLTIHCASTWSGTGKSLALDLAASIWGDPSQYRTPKGTSAVAMQQRLGLLQHLPLISDELTSNARNKDALNAWLPTFLLDMTQGKGKERMESGTNSERVNTTTWSTIALMSSNTHWTDLLTGSKEHSAEGELRRLLEFKMDRQMTPTPEEEVAIRSLYENFGVVGQLLAQYYVDHEPEMKALVDQCGAKMRADLQATGDERYWFSAIAAAMAAGIIIGRELGVQLPLDTIMSRGFGVSVAHMREAIGSSKKTAEGVLSSFITENYGKMLVLTKGADHKWTQVLGGLSDVRDESITRTTIMARIERDLTANWSDIVVQEQVMKSHCSAMSFSYVDFKRELAKVAKVTTHPHYNLTKGTKAPRVDVNVLKIGRPLDESDELLKPATSMDAA